MTMEVRCIEAASPTFLSTRGESPTTESNTSPPVAKGKRPFDVAFLMAPDDSSKRRQQIRYSSTITTRDIPEKITTPLNLLLPTITSFNNDDNREATKSAFTKVMQPVRNELNIPPTSPASTLSEGTISPDVTSYRETPSPVRSPVQYTKPLQLFNNKQQTLLSPFQYTTKREEHLNKSHRYPPDVIPYGGLSVPSYSFPSAFPASTPGSLLGTALLPPSLAALSPLAQNVCAKCNISFRMTSDLVYHMRSQHKGDSVASDSARRRREQEKLRCPVCNESFRERHHLTRHMTAHQDKDGDLVDDDATQPRRIK